MERVIVAFENESTAQKIKEILETGATASCQLCHSAAEVRRMVQKTHLRTVICGFKLPDDSCEGLYADLPEDCNMLMITVQSRLELLENCEIFHLPSPVKRGDLVGAVQMLLQLAHRGERRRPPRTSQEQELINAAKNSLMVQYAMSEADAHHFLQKLSMDSGAKLADTAKKLLEQS